MYRKNVYQDGPFKFQKECMTKWTNKGIFYILLKEIKIGQFQLK